MLISFKEFSLLSLIILTSLFGIHTIQIFFAHSAVFDRENTKEINETFFCRNNLEMQLFLKEVIIMNFADGNTNDCQCQQCVWVNFREPNRTMQKLNRIQFYKNWLLKQTSLSKFMYSIYLCIQIYSVEIFFS